MTEPQRKHRQRYAGGARLHFAAILGIFAANGLQAGILTMLIADVAAALHLNGSALGIALGIFSGTSLLSVGIGSSFSDRWGRRFVLVAGMLGTGLFYLLLGAVDQYGTLLALVCFGGFALGLFDLSYPTLGGDYERQYDVSSMTQFYAGFDGANALGALISGIALAVGVAYGMIYMALGILLLILGVVALSLPFPMSAARPAARSHALPPRRSGPSLLRTPGIVSAMLFVGLIALVDAALEGYTSIYLRDVLQSGALLAGVAIAVSSLASLVGLIGNVVVIRRLGERNAMIGAGIGTALGIVALVITPVPGVAAIGLLALRASEAPIVPISFSLAARSAPQETAGATAWVWRMMYIAFIVGPLIVGAMADVIGLRATLALFTLTSLGIAGIAHSRLR